MAGLSRVAGWDQLGLLAAQSADRRIVRSARPQDLETPVALLNSWITPNDLFYVRSHLYTPTLDGARWALSVDGEVERPLTLRMNDLRQMPSVTLPVTLECAGNGRALFDPPVAGAQWKKAPSETLGGLASVSATCSNVPESRHQGDTSGWMVLISRWAMCPTSSVRCPCQGLDPDTLLAYEMNGEPLPVPNGFPLRAIVPGLGRCLFRKWLTHIRVSEREQDGFFVQTAYRYPKRPVAPGTVVDPKDTEPLTGLTVKSLIVGPFEGATLQNGLIPITGASPGPARLTLYAWTCRWMAGSTWVPARSAVIGRGMPGVSSNIGGTPRQPGRICFCRAQPMTVVVSSRWWRNGIQAGIYSMLSIEYASMWRKRSLRFVLDGRTSLIVAVLLAGGAIVSAQGVTNLPPAPGVDIVRAACLGCHGVELILQQRLTRTGWEREVDKMIRWGAPVMTDVDRALVVGYLTRRDRPDAAEWRGERGCTGRVRNFAAPLRVVSSGGTRPAAAADSHRLDPGGREDDAMGGRRERGREAAADPVSQ